MSRYEEYLEEQRKAKEKHLAECATRPTPTGIQHLHLAYRSSWQGKSYYWKTSKRSELCGTSRCRIVAIIDENATRALFSLRS